MAQRLSVRVRRCIYQAHLWVALAVCVILVPVGLTGSIITWPEQVNRFLMPAPEATSPLFGLVKPSTYVTAARIALPPNARIQALRMPRASGEPVTIVASAGPPGPEAGRLVWLDPASGHVLKTGRAISPAFRALHEFHSSLLAGGTGGVVVGIAGFAMLLLSLSGLWLWWPMGRNRSSRAFRWRRTSRTLLNLHYMAGVWISIPLLILSATGVLISFPLIGATLWWPSHTAGKARSASAKPAAEHRLSLSPDQAVARALAARPTMRRVVAITFPDLQQQTSSTWRVDLIGARGSASVTIDDSTNSVADVPVPTPAAGERLNRAIHDGELSLTWKWIVTLAGLAPAILATTGVIAWLRTQSRQSSTAKRRQDAAQLSDARSPR